MSTDADGGDDGGGDAPTTLPPQLGPQVHPVQEKNPARGEPLTLITVFMFSYGLFIRIYVMLLGVV